MARPEGDGAGRGRTSQEPLRILVSDDSPVYRAILRRLLTSIPGVEVVAEASNGREALEHIGFRRPDLVLLDCEMPELDGLSTLRVLQHRYPDLPVFMVSSMSDTERTTEALRLGAWDFILKPCTTDAAGARLLGRLVAALSSVRRAQRAPKAASIDPTPSCVPRTISTSSNPRFPLPLSCLVIAASTGGPRALEELLPQLPESLNVPVLVVQHMPAGFTASLARGLARRARMPVLHAEHGQRLEANHIWIAAGGSDIRVQRQGGSQGELQITLQDDERSGALRPSADILMRSLADTLRAPVLSVVLTGMGDDARAGVEALRAYGGLCIAQDQVTSTVFGMPRAVIEAGLADHVLPLDAIAQAIVELVTTHGRRGDRTP